jgi:hypothetical protein
MKIRIGFVSNSSSSSFVCNYDDSEYNHYKASELPAIKEKLETIFKSMQMLELVSIHTKFSEVFQEPRKATRADIKEFNEGWDKDFEYHDDMYLINSTGDNTIPSEFFDIILNMFNAERVHLG